MEGSSKDTMDTAGQHSAEKKDQGSTTNSEIASLLKTLAASVEKLTSAASDQPPAKRHRSRESYSNPASDIEDDEGEGEISTETRAAKCKMFLVSDETKALLQACFALPRPVSNKTRNAWVAQYGLAEGDVTKCPKLGTIIKNELPREALEVDRKLSRLQNFVLDATGPLAAAYDELVGENEAYPDPDRIQQAIQLSLRILGNASAQISQERRTKALSRLNPDLKSLVEDEDFSNTAPNLFGAGFEKKAKERSEAVTCLRKASSSDLKKMGEHNSRRFFQGSHPLWRGGRENAGRYHSEHYKNRQQRSLPPKNGTERRQTGQ